jgi:hypothetical protein
VLSNFLVLTFVAKNIHSTMKTLAALVASSATEADFSFGLKNWLDAFYACPSVDPMVPEPPFYQGSTDHPHLVDAYLAAVVEQLTRAHAFTTPAWVWDQRRISERPYFAWQSEKARIFLLMDSPPAFRQRNIFVSHDCLSRV